MEKPTPKEAFENKCRKFIKELWEKDLLQSKDELISVGFEPDVIRESNFIKVVTEKGSVQIHKTSFENFFNSRTHEQTESCKNKIKSLLKRCL